MHKITKHLTHIGVVSALAATSFSAYGSDIALEEIIVTATKTGRENLQTVPIAVTALSTEQLDKGFVVDIQGIALRTPGLAVGEFNVGQPQIFIRGIGSNDDGAGSDQSVGVFVDEVFLGRASGAALDIFDLEQVEVLRGPQGTLYGKNVIGGALSFTTKKPTTEPEAKIEVSVGNLNHQKIRGYVTGPLTESGKLLGKFAGSSNQRDGFVTDRTGELEFNDRNDTALRGQLRYLPNDSLILDLTGDVSRKRQTGPGRVTRGTAIAVQQEAIDPVAFADPFVTFADEEGFQDRDIFGLTGRVEWVGESGNLVSITAYRDNEYRFLDDVFGQQFPLPLDFDNGATEESTQFSQELRYNSSWGGVDYTVGVFYLNEEINRNEFVTNPTTLGRGDSFQRTDTDSYAVFAQLKYAITDRLGLVVGARQSQDKKDSVQNVIGNPDVIITRNDVPVTSASDTFSAFTPRFVLDYEVNDDIFLYGSVSRGYKAGGFQGTPANSDVAGNSFDPEFAWNYEVGIKSELFNNRARINLTAFYTDYEDIQVLQFIVPDPAFPNVSFIAVDNAATAEITGIETEFIFLLSESFEISGSYAYLDATYDEFVDANGGDFAGNNLRNAPENSFNINATYTHELARGGQIIAYYEQRGQSRAFQDPAGDARLAASIPSYSLASGSLSYVNAEGNWKFDLWVENLFDEEYFTHNFPAGNPNGFATPGAPRTYGARLTWTF